MVNKYKKKTKQGTWDEKAMQTAINLCKAGDSIKSTAKKYALAYATLYRHEKTGIAASNLGRFRPVFTEDQEIDAVAQNAVHGFGRPGFLASDEDYEPAAVIAGTSNMNIGTESTNALETINIPRPFAETSSTPSPSLLQEQIPSNLVDPLSEIFPSPNRTPSCEFQDFVAPIVNTPEKIRYYGCTPEPEPGCSRIVSTFGPDIAAQRGDTVVPETEENIRQNTSRDNSLDSKPGCSASHCSPLVLRPIPNPAKPMTTR
ncbi:hypothetical protein FQA39_LY13691 [Lamprigera yunnana]|nr:hypothetical protein FQA39_LY13691 [Lamprigera yunnana]